MKHYTKLHNYFILLWHFLTFYIRSATIFIFAAFHYLLSLCTR